MYILSIDISVKCSNVQTHRVFERLNIEHPYSYD